MAEMSLAPLLHWAPFNVTAHPPTATSASVPTSHYSMWHYSCICTLKG